MTVKWHILCVLHVCHLKDTVLFWAWNVSEQPLKNELCKLLKVAGQNVRPFRPERCRRVCCLPVFTTAMKPGEAFKGMDGIRMAVCRRLGPPTALLSAEWASYQRPGYAAEPPQGSVRAQAGEWTLAQSHTAVNTFGLGFQSRGAWISLLLLMIAIRQSVLSFKLVNYGAILTLGLKVVSAIQSRNITEASGPAPFTTWDTLMVWGPGWFITVSVFLGAFWDCGGHSDRGLHCPYGTRCN